MAASLTRSRVANRVAGPARRAPLRDVTSEDAMAGELSDMYLNERKVDILMSVRTFPASDLGRGASPEPGRAKKL